LVRVGGWGGLLRRLGASGGGGLSAVKGGFCRDEALGRSVSLEARGMGLREGWKVEKGEDLIVFFCRISSLLDCADRKHGWVLEIFDLHIFVK